MQSHQLPPQPFEALCEVASQEKWCWKMVCTTCGHMLFRYGLRQLALGNSPRDPAWLVHTDHPVLCRGSPLRALGPVPPLSGWPIEEQRKLVSVLQQADISRVAASCTFPDWLGYLGLALHYTEDVEFEDHQLTRSWAPQLARLVLPGSRAAQLLADIETDKNRALVWRDMEAIELGAAR